MIYLLLTHLITLVNYPTFRSQCEGIFNYLFRDLMKAWIVILHDFHANAIGSMSRIWPAMINTAIFNLSSAIHGIYRSFGPLLFLIELIHWGRGTHICVGDLTNAEKMLIGPFETTISKILIEIHTFSFWKYRLQNGVYFFSTWMS